MLHHAVECDALDRTMKHRFGTLESVGEPTGVEGTAFAHVSDGIHFSPILVQYFSYEPKTVGPL